MLICQRRLSRPVYLNKEYVFTYVSPDLPEYRRLLVVCYTRASEEVLQWVLGDDRDHELVQSQPTLQWQH